MNKKGNMAIISLTVALIIGLIALTVGWELIQDKTATTEITDDQFTAVNGSCTRITSASDKCISNVAGTIRLENASNGEDVLGNFTLCGSQSSSSLNGYSLTTIPSLDGATINATYNEIACTQLTGTTATITNYVPLLWAVALLVLVAGFIGVGMLK